MTALLLPLRTQRWAAAAGNATQKRFHRTALASFYLAAHLRTNANFVVQAGSRRPDTFRHQLYRRSAADQPKDRSYWHLRDRCQNTAKPSSLTSAVEPLTSSQPILTAGLTDRVSPASVKAGAGCAGGREADAPLADAVTPKLDGCIRKLAR
jgi:hypothetical protein